MNLQFDKIKKIITFLVPVVFLIAQPLFRISAQEIIQGNKKYNETIFTLRVKQLNEFIDRFNFEKDFLNRIINENFASKISRPEYIRLLFDEEDLIPDTNNTNQYEKLVDEFVAEVEDSSYRINKYSEKIFAELDCIISYNNQKTGIQILLNQEITEGLKWSICAISAQFIDESQNIYNIPDSSSLVFRCKYDSTNYIPPYSNETNFIVLKRLLNENNKNLPSLNSSIYNSDSNNLFYYLINQGTIKFHHVEKISYHILDIPGWSLILNNFIRNTENSGWLISDLKTINSRDYQYFKEKYKIDIADN